MWELKIGTALVGLENDREYMVKDVVSTTSTLKPCDLRGCGLTASLDGSSRKYFKIKEDMSIVSKGDLEPLEQHLENLLGFWGSKQEYYAKAMEFHKEGIYFEKYKNKQEESLACSKALAMSVAKFLNNE